MLINMQREVFEELDNEALISACFAPLIRTYKEVSSEDGDPSEFYHKLTTGQQTLFIFNAYYLHVKKSAQEFYWWSAFFMAQEARWAALKAKIRELEDLELTALLEDVEHLLRRRNHPRPLTEFAAVSRDELDSDLELGEYFHSAYERLIRITMGTTVRLGGWIRSSPQSFVQLI